MAGVEPAGDDLRRRHQFEHVFRTHYHAVHGYVMSHYPTLDTAAILSNTFDIAWRRLDDIPPAAERGWLIGVARNCARNEARTARRHINYLETFAHAHTATNQPEPITADVIATVVAAFGKLTDADREVLLLADWEQLPLADLAAALEITTNAATVRLHRARKRLRAYLRDEDRP